MWCECSKCSGKETPCNAFEPCINAAMENEHSHMKSKMNRDNFRVVFAAILIVLGILGIFL